MNALEQLMCRTAYIRGSFARSADGAGVGFCFYSVYWKAFLYACRDFELTVDGEKIANESLSLCWRGKTYPVTQLNSSDCSVPEGEVIGVKISAGEYFLEGVQHRVQVRFKSGGDYGFDGNADWIGLVVFTDSLNSKTKSAIAQHCL